MALSLNFFSCSNHRRLFQIAESSADRCLTFTLGFSAVGLSTALDEYFKGNPPFLTSQPGNGSNSAWSLCGTIELFAKLGLLLRHIRKSCGLDGPKDKPRKQQVSEEGFEEEPLLSFYQQDWSHLQGALRVTEICYTLAKKIEVFESGLREKVLCSSFVLILSNF